MTVGSVCNRDVVLVTPKESLVEGAQRMRDFHVGSLVVVSDLSTRNPVGLLTDRDMVVSAIAQSPERLMSLSVGDVMSGDVVTAPESLDLEGALHKMLDHGIRRLPVVDREMRVVGILTFDNAVELLSEELIQLTKLVTSQQRKERVRRPLAHREAVTLETDAGD